SLEISRNSIKKNGTGLSSEPRGTYLFPDLGDSATENTLATEEFVETALANYLQAYTVEISSAQLLAIATTPVELIPAQGAGTYIVIDNVVSIYQYGTEPY